MSKDRPAIITFLGDWNIFCALLAIMALFPFMHKLGIFVAAPDFLKFLNISDELKSLLFAITMLIISYGYLKLNRWCYWLMVSIKLIAMVGWFTTYKHNSSAQYPISIMIELIFIIPTIKYFSKRDKIQTVDTSM